MSLQIAAQNLAAKGRGNDSMLIHMTPREVGGLQALAMAHGGSLTINPKTGLPEAGFLENILPTLLGVGLSFIPGVGPLAAGAIVGGAETLRTGDLGKGLLAGLGAYGGAGLGGSLAGPTSIGAQAATNQAAGQVIADNAAATIGADGLSQVSTNLGNTPSAVDFTSQGVGSQIKGSLSAIGQPGGLDAYGSNLVSQFGSPTKAAMGAFGVGAPFIPGPKPIEMPKPDEGFNYEGPYVPSDRQVNFPGASNRSSSEFTYFSPSNPIPGYQPMYMAEGGSADSGAESAPAADGRAAVSPAEADVFRSIMAVQQAAGIPAITMPPIAAPEVVPGATAPSVPTAPPSTGEINYGFSFGNNIDPQASGLQFYKPIEERGLKGIFRNIASIFNQDEDTNPANYEAYTPSSRVNLSDYQYDPVLKGYVLKRATGGLTALAAGGSGRFLQGPGDGTSDSIPAVIGEKQPARLADGEFVIDARTVSELGNGSSKAGAQKLYRMMDRVHSARKKAGRGKDSKAEKYLPA